MSDRVGSTAQIVAHGIGDRQDLPIPFEFALAGAGAAVAVSFVAVAVLWRTPLFRGNTAGTPIPAAVQVIADHQATRGALRAVGLALALFVLVAAVLGPNTGQNPTAGFVYVLFWVGLVPASLLFGPVWRLLNPLRTIHRSISALAGSPPEQGLRPYPERLGYWPAAAGLFAFTWLELVAPGRTSTTTLLIWLGAYVVVQLAGAMVFGSEWFQRADAFEVFSTFIGRLAPIGRRTDGRLVLRNPLDGLDGLRPAPGVVGVACVLLGSTAYDSISDAPFWVRILQSGALDPTAMGTIGLAGTVLAVAVLFGVAVTLAGVVGSVSRARLPGLPDAFAHSVVPIAVGYLVAHYFSLFLFEGQRTLILASDPLGTGANLFGTAQRAVDFTLVGATTIATVQVSAIVVGHVLGVVAAHDRAVRLFAPRHAALGQLPLAVLMVGYTVGGLALLFAA